jgi:hypothetical protein
LIGASQDINSQTVDSSLKTNVFTESGATVTFQPTVTEGQFNNGKFTQAGKVFFELTVIDPASEESSTTINYVGNPAINVSRFIKNESGLACFPSGGQIISMSLLRDKQIYASEPDEDFPGDGQLAGVASTIAVRITGPFYSFENLIYPSLIVSGSTFDAIVPAFGLSVSSVASPNQNAGGWAEGFSGGDTGSTASISATILDKSVSVLYPDTDTFVLGEFGSEFYWSMVPTSITLEPHKYWPYKDAAGTPLYDEDTGERI